MKHRKATPALTRFDDLFARMTPALQRVLVGLLTDLDAFGDLANRPQPTGWGDFLGYDGVQNAGELQDLILSEWAMYDLERTEFLRRMAERETLFRRKTFEMRKSGLARCVLVDAGAWMLGHNRLVALAALFWQADIAARSGLEFYWATSVRGSTWQHGLNEDTITAYLGQVAQSELHDKSVTRVLADLPGDIEPDLWLIGADRAQTADYAAQFRAALLVGQAALPQADAAARAPVAIWSNGQVRSRQTVIYPDDGDCIAAFRRPFVAKKVTVHAQPEAGQSSVYPTYWHPELDIFWYREGVLIDPKGRNVWVPFKGQLIGIERTHAAPDGTVDRLLIKSAGKHYVREVSHKANKVAIDDTWLTLAKGVEKQLSYHSGALPHFAYHKHRLLGSDAQGFDLELVQKADGFLMRRKRHAARRVYSDEARRVVLVPRDDAIPPYLEVTDAQNGQLKFTASVSAEIEKHGVSHVLYANSAKALMVLEGTVDQGRTRYAVLGPNTDAQLILPEGHQPVVMINASKGITYHAHENTFFRYSATSGGAATWRRLQGDGDLPGPLVSLRQIRGRALGGVVLEDGVPVLYAHVTFTKTRFKVETFDLMDALAAAEVESG